LSSAETSRVMEPLIRAAVDRQKPVGLPPNPYGGGLVGAVCRLMGEAISRDNATAIAYGALSPLLLRLKPGEKLLWTDKGEPVAVRRVPFEWSISDDELRL
jgi:hypothetical protein